MCPIRPGGANLNRVWNVYGTIARMKVLPGAAQKLRDHMAGIASDLEVTGWRSTNIYQSDNDPDELWMAVVFDSKDAYHKNAQSPEQNERYKEMRSLLAADPEWHDGEIIESAAPRS